MYAVGGLVFWPVAGIKHLHFALLQTIYVEFVHLRIISTVVSSHPDDIYELEKDGWFFLLETAFEHL